VTLPGRLASDYCAFYDGTSSKKNKGLDVAGRDICDASGRNRGIIVRDASSVAKA
jgi:hypothetical protein